MFLGNINTRNLLSVPRACCHYMKRWGVGSVGGRGGAAGRKSSQTCRFGRAASLGVWQTVPDATLKALD